MPAISDEHISRGRRNNGMISAVDMTVGKHFSPETESLDGSLIRFQKRRQGSGRKRLSPCRAPRRSLLPLSPKRTQVRLKSLLLACLATPDPIRTHGRPSVQECRLRLKRIPSSSRTLARHLPFKSSTAARSCSYGLFPWAALLRFAFGQKIWHTIFFSSKPTFKILPKLLPKPRGASPSPKDWHVTVHPRYPAWSIYGCWLGKTRLQTRCCDISVLLRRCPAPRLKNCVNSFQKAKQRRSWQLSRSPMLPTPNTLYQLPLITLR